MPFTAYVRIPKLEAMQSLNVVEENLYIGQLRWIDPASLDILRPYPGIAAPLNWTTNQLASRAPGVILARMKFPLRLKAFLARPKASKESGTDTGRSDEINGTARVRKHPGLTIFQDALLNPCHQVKPNPASLSQLIDLLDDRLRGALWVAIDPATDDCYMIAT